MNREGQGNGRRSRAGRSALDDGGYIMVALLVGMAVTAVWMSALLPSWRQQAMREKEADLVFRGEQYARAIALYWRKNNQTLPGTIDILVSQRYLRKKYKDPMTGQDFMPLGGLNIGLSPGQPPGAPPQGGRATTPQVGRGAAGPGGQQMQFTAQQRGGRITMEATISPSGQVTLTGGAGISGVRSTSNETSIRIYRGQQSYSQFPFDYTIALQRMGAATIPSAPGQPGRSRGIGAPVRPGQEIQPIQPGGRPGMGGFRIGGPDGRGGGVGMPPPQPPPGRGR
jgi:hypothetical protein